MHAVSRRRRLTASLLTVLFAADSALADIQNTFVWGFQTIKGNVLQECAKVQIFVGPNSGATAPYTIFAYEANGIPTIQTLGSDVNNMWWTVDHSAGSQLVLSMADAAGNSGGVATDPVTVTQGNTTSCHATNPTSAISITTNTTKTLNSCDVLPLKISGGQMPYTITVASLDSTAVTNVSMGAYDQYNWVNRASPNSQLIAVVSDATGTYGPGTALLSTAGTTDLTCNGRQSTFIDGSGKISASQSGTAAVTKATSTGDPSPSSGSGTSSGSSTGPIIGGVVGGLVLVGALLAGLVFFLRKKRSRAMGPRQYLDPDPHQGFGLGKVGGAPGQGGYAGVPVAEEITPFVTAGAHSTPYRDYDQNQSNQGLYGQSHYNQSSYQSSYSSGADTLTGTPSHQDMSGRFISAPQLPPGAASSPPLSPRPISPTISATTFDPYSTHNNVPLGSSSGPSTYSTSTSQPPMGLAPARSASGPVAGGSGSTGLLAIANPTGDEMRSTDVKGGPIPAQAPPQNVYQHEDVADVEELPPAYKERTA